MTRSMSQGEKMSRYVLAWILWALTVAWGVYITFWAVRDAIMSVTEVITAQYARYGTSAQQFQVRLTRNAVDRFSVFTLGVLLVVFVVATESYYRDGVDRHQLGRRFVQITAIEFGVLFVALATQAICQGALGLFTIWSILVPCGVLAVTVALSWVLTKLPKESSSA